VIVSPHLIWLINSTGYRSAMRLPRRGNLTRFAGTWTTITALYAASFVADYLLLPYFDHRHRGQAVG
jgi:hypothetical protein